jgi:two-component system chemotaxis response regulator CheY
LERLPAATRLLIAKLVTGWGDEVVEAADGEDAWARVAQTGASVVICDWEMPRLDGPSLCRRLRAAPLDRYVYVLLLTANGKPEDIVRGLESGADDYVTKPFVPAELKARLDVGRRILALQDELASRNSELERANLDLARMAATDALTHAGNRRSFEDHAARLHDAVRTRGEPYGVLMLDLDHFKSINDRFGHAFGDRVLVALAGAVRSAVGGAGTLYRFGGEEFVVVAPGARAADVAALGEATRAAIAAMELRTAEGERVPVTASVGATSQEDAAETGADVVVDRADRALYAAKRGGRNRVEVER